MSQEDSFQQEIEKLRRDLLCLQTLETYRAQELAAARQMMSEARALEERMRRLVISMCEAFEPRALTELLRKGRQEVENWSVDDWVSWLLTTHTRTMRNRGTEPDRARSEEERLGQLEKELQQEKLRAERAEREIAFLRERLRQAEERPPREFAVAETRQQDESERAEVCASGVEPVARREESGLEGREKSGEIGEYWGSYPRELVDGVIRVLARGQECRRRQIIEALGLPWSGRLSGLFRFLAEGGWIEEEEVRIGRGSSTLLLSLTEQGEWLAKMLGETPSFGLKELLLRHRSLEQALLALRARDLLQEWGYEVSLWPGAFRTQSGRSCQPDLTATLGKTIYVELELHPVVRSPRTYRANAERLAKWGIFHEVNTGALYIVCPSSVVESQMIAEIAVWHEVTKQQVHLFATCVESHEPRWWQERVFG